jgi:hypothetical protein
LLILRSAFWACGASTISRPTSTCRAACSATGWPPLSRAASWSGREYREAGQRARIEYQLTRMGQALGLPFMAMTAWGDKWLGDGISPLTLLSKSTGQKFSVALVDERGRLAQGSDIEMAIDSRFERKRRRAVASMAAADRRRDERLPTAHRSPR